MNKLVFIGEDSLDAPCEYCGKVTELRPYGKNGAKICFDCGMKPENIKLAEETFDAILLCESEMPQPDQSN